MAADPLANPYAAPQPVSALDDVLLIESIDPARAIIAEGVVTEADFYAAQKLNRSARRLTDLIPWFVILGILCGIEILFFFDDADRYVMLLIGGLAACVLITILFMSFQSAVIPRRAIRRVWQRSRSLQVPMRRVISPELVQTITPDSNVTLRWSAYANYRESAEVVLFYLAENPQLFFIFPRAMFRSEADWDRFQLLVRENLPKA